MHGFNHNHLEYLKLLHQTHFGNIYFTLSKVANLAKTISVFSFSTSSQLKGKCRRHYTSTFFFPSTTRAGYEWNLKPRPSSFFPSHRCTEVLFASFLSQRIYYYGNHSTALEYSAVQCSGEFIAVIWLLIKRFKINRLCQNFCSSVAGL